MNKYLVKPTEIVDHNGYVKGITNVEQNINGTLAEIDTRVKTIEGANYIKNISDMNIYYIKQLDPYPTDGSNPLSVNITKNQREHYMEHNNNSIKDITVVVNKLWNKVYNLEQNSGTGSGTSCNCNSTEFSVPIFNYVHDTESNSWSLDFDGAYFKSTNDKELIAQLTNNIHNLPDTIRYLTTAINYNKVDIDNLYSKFEGEGGTIENYTLPKWNWHNFEVTVKGDDPEFTIVTTKSVADALEHNFNQLAGAIGYAGAYLEVYMAEVDALKESVESYSDWQSDNIRVLQYSEVSDEAAAALGVDKSSVLEEPAGGLIKYGIQLANKAIGENKLLSNRVTTLESGSCSCNETLAAIDTRLKTIEETKYVNLETYKATYMVTSSTNDNELLTSTRVSARIDVLGSTNGDSINVMATAVNNLNTKINLVDGTVQAYAEIIESNKSRITALEENQTPTDLTELQSDVSLLKTTVQNHNTKITALQSKDCLTRELTVKPYENYTQDQCDRWGVDKNQTITLPADQMIQGSFMLLAANQADFNYLNDTTIPALETRVAALESASATTASDDLVVIDQQISTLNNRVNLLENNVTNNTTKIGVHTTDIAALQNRIVDLETTVSSQANTIADLISRIEALEQK